jgi:hypothetical protein
VDSEREGEEMRIKNWDKYQHHNGGKIYPWIKLHRSVLDDMEWHLLNPEAAKILVSLWLLASEKDGELPDVERIAFRLRLSKDKVINALSKLEHWIIRDGYCEGTQRVPDGYSQGALDKIRVDIDEEEIEIKNVCLGAPDAFAEFWKAYPKKIGKGAALTSWQKHHLDKKLPEIHAAVKVQSGSAQWKKDGGQFIPNPATWLNQSRWEDELMPVTDRLGDPITPTDDDMPPIQRF